MANVKIMDKRKLEELQAKLVLRNGRKLAQQDILDKCVEFSDTHLDQFIVEQVDTPQLTKEKISKILASSIKCETYYTELSDDELLYGKVLDKR